MILRKQNALKCDVHLSYQLVLVKPCSNILYHVIYNYIYIMYSIYIYILYHTYKLSAN